MDWTKEENWHEAAKIFPMSEATLAALTEDIKQNGLHDPVILFEGRVLDGRHRLLACQRAGVEPRFEKWQPQGAPLDFVISQNLMRRQMSRDQMAALADELKDVLATEARKRQREAGKHGAQGGRGRKKQKPSAGIPAEGFGKSAALAAARFGVSTDAVERIGALEKAMPGTRDKIKAGVLTTRAAEKQWEQSPTNPRQRKVLADFLVSPPFSFLDPTAEYWKKRKLEWASIFDPVLWECMIRWFAPTAGGRILDPFAGGCTRGIVAGFLGYQYTGVEWRPGQADINKRQADVINFAKPSTRLDPAWIQANGNRVTLPDAESYDMVLTSAPLYSGNDANWKTYEDFLAWYESICAQAVTRLKENRLLVIAVEELTDDAGIIRCFVEQNITLFERLGLAHYNRMTLRTYPELPAWTLPPAHFVQIGCFWKGDEKELARIHEHLGTIPTEKIAAL